MKKSFLAIAAFAAGLALSTGAQASTVSIDLGSVGAGASGSSTLSKAKSIDYFASGVLKPDTEIVFSYTSNSVASGILTAAGKFGSTNTSATSFGSKETSSVFPIVATANIGSNPVKGTVTIENTTSSSKSFSATFLSFILGGPGRKATVSYLVSAIPLPASMILFLSGIVAMCGFGTYRKNGSRA